MQRERRWGERGRSRRLFVVDVLFHDVDDDVQHDEDVPLGQMDMTE